MLLVSSFFEEKKNKTKCNQRRDGTSSSYSQISYHRLVLVPSIPFNFLERKMGAREGAKEPDVTDDC
jgi:hypothetical protein